MVSTSTIRNPGDLEELLRTLVAEAIEGKTHVETPALKGARVLRGVAIIDPSFIIELPDGRQFIVIVREETAEALLP